MGVLDKFLDAIKLNDDYDDDELLDDSILEDEGDYDDDDFLDDDDDMEEKPKKKFCIPYRSTPERMPTDSISCPPSASVPSF